MLSSHVPEACYIHRCKRTYAYAGLGENYKKNVAFRLGPQALIKPGTTVHDSYATHVVLWFCLKFTRFREPNFRYFKGVCFEQQTHLITANIKQIYFSRGKYGVSSPFGVWGALPVYLAFIQRHTIAVGILVMLRQCFRKGVVTAKIFLGAEIQVIVMFVVQHRIHRSN